VLSAFIALSVGVTAIVARRKGENLPDKASQTLRNALVLIAGLTVVVMTLTLIFSRRILLIAGAQPETIQMADEYFRIMVYFLPVNTITLCINAAQRGVGDTRITMVANIAANVVNIFFDYLFIYGNWGFPKLGVAGDAWASGIGFCVGMIISVVACFASKGSSHFLHLSFKEDWRLHRETVTSILKIGGNSAIEQIAQRAGFFVYAIIIANLGTEVFAAHQVGMQFLSLSFNFASGLAAAAV
jgi:putative MATE family efflux protein